MNTKIVIKRHMHINIVINEVWKTSSGFIKNNKIWIITKHKVFVYLIIS